VAGGVAAALVDCGGDTFSAAGSDAEADAGSTAVDSGGGTPEGAAPDTAAPKKCRPTKAPATSTCSANASACTTQLVVAGNTLPPQRFSFGLAVDDTFVYWADQLGHDPGGPGRVRRAKKNPGGDPNAILDLALDQANPVNVQVDDQFVYWATLGLPISGGGRRPGRVVRLRKSSCNADTGCPDPEILYEEAAPSVEGFSRLIVLDQRTLYVLGTARQFVLRQTEAGTFVVVAETPKTGDGRDIAASETSLFYSIATRSQVGRMPYGGGPAEVFPVTPVDGGAVGFGLLASDCQALYGSLNATWELTRVAWLGDGSKVTAQILAPLPHYAFGLAADELFVYAALPDDGGVFRVRKDGSEKVASKMANEAADVWDIALDDEAVYYSEHGTGAIRRLTK